MSNSNENKTKKVVKIVLNVLLWIFLVFAFLMMVVAFTSRVNDYNVPMVSNKIVLTVESDSMSPTFNKGDMLIGTVLTDAEKAELKGESAAGAADGDIITFYVDLNGDGIKELNTHRIVWHEGDLYLTRGDNNNSPDEYNVHDYEIVSIWHEGDTRIAGLGGFIGFLQGRVGFLIFIILPLLAFFIYELVKFIILIVKLKNGDKKKLSAEEEAIRQRLYEEYLLKQQAEGAAVGAPDNGSGNGGDDQAK